MTTIETPTERPTAVIRGGEVGVCLTRIHHDRFTEAVGETSAVRMRLAHRGLAFEAEVLDVILSEYSGSTVVVDRHAKHPYDETLQAIRAGVDLIVGGRMRSADGTLVGAPDLLVRLSDGYAAVDIKGHKVHSESGLPISLAPLDDLVNPAIADDLRFRSFRKRDLFQVAHYWRILESLGHATGRAVGGIIGTDAPVACTWVDLDTEDASILADTEAWIESALGAIDHGSEHPGAPLIAAWWRGECRRCSWQALCREQLEAVDDPTLIAGITDIERDSLASTGVMTGTAIATLDPHDDRIADPSTVYDARVQTSGHLLRFGHPTPSLDLPSARREVDFDIETYDGRIYLAGFLVTEEDESHFDPIIDWLGTDASERRFIGALFDRLASYATDDTVVLHWSDYERAQLELAAERHDLSIEGFSKVSEWFEGFAVDLYDWTKSRFVSPHGFSLKAIAPMCGFEWRDDDPGGLQSEIWYELMLDGDRAMRSRLLEYNEDDVAAQLAIRRWIRDQDGGDGPGSSIPFVESWKP